MAKIADRLPDVTPEWFEENVNEFNKMIVGEFLQQAHLSNKTVTNYCSALHIFFKFVFDQCMNKPLHELKPRDALKYQNFLINRGLSSSAVKLKRSAVSSLCGFLELYYNDEFPLFRNIYSKQIPNAPVNRVHKKEPLTEEEISHLINVLKEREEWQMVAYLTFTYNTGCRREESRLLLKEVINYEKVIDKKTGEEKNYYLTHDIRCKGRSNIGKIRRFPFSQEAMDALKKWIEVRGEDNCPHMFVTINKDEVHQVSDSTFNYWCTEIFSKIVGRRVHPHLLRSSRATNAVLYENKSIDAVKSLLGHNSTETTQIYIVKDNEDDVDELF